MAWNEPGNGNKPRDPWSGRSGGTPPDLEDMLKRLKARFAGKGGPQGAGPLAGGAGLVFGAIAMLWVASGFYVVDEQERAAVLRFGAFTVVTEPGLRWHIPWPVENEEIVNVTQVRQVTDRADMLTQDENIVDVELKVQYRVSSAELYLFSVDDPDSTLRQALKSAVREVVGRSTMDVLTDGREKIAADTKTLLQQSLDEYKTGLAVSEVNLLQAQPPEAVQSAFVDAIKAREDRQRLKNEAEAYSNDRLPRARGAAARQTAEAEAYRERNIARAEGEAARFTKLLVEYQKAPKVTRERLYLEAMSEVLSNSSKIMVDVSKGSPMLYLPLEQLMKQMPRNAGSEAPELSIAPQTAPGKTNNDSRSRDREIR